MAATSIINSFNQIEDCFIALINWESSCSGAGSGNTSWFISRFRVIKQLHEFASFEKCNVCLTNLSPVQVHTHFEPTFFALLHSSGQHNEHWCLCSIPYAGMTHPQLTLLGRVHKWLNWQWNKVAPFTFFSPKTASPAAWPSEKCVLWICVRCKMEWCRCLTGSKLLLLLLQV